MAQLVGGGGKGKNRGGIPVAAGNGAQRQDIIREDERLERLRAVKSRRALMAQRQITK
jgi:hypothetical protein